MQSRLMNCCIDKCTSKIDHHFYIARVVSIILFLLCISTQGFAAGAQEKSGEDLEIEDTESLVPKLDWDFHGRLAVLPLQNRGAAEHDWVSIAIQDSLTQDFWHVEAFDTRSLRTFSGKFTELCPKLDLRCVVTQPSNELQKTLSDQFLSYAVSGDYKVENNQLEITLNWGYARDTADPLPGPKKIVVISTLENLTDDLSQSLLKWVKGRGVELSSEHATRFEQPKTHVISALKATALGYWYHQGYYLNKEDQVLIARWEEQLIKATKTDSSFLQAWSHLGWLYLNVGDKDKALRAFKKSMEINNTQTDPLFGFALSQPETDVGKENALKSKKIVAERNRGILAYQNNLGQELSNRTLYQKELSVRLRGLGLAQEIFGDGAGQLSEYFYKVGYTYYDLSNYSQSLEYYSYALSIAEATYGKGHISTANALNNLGLVYRRLAEYPKALEYYTRSLAVKEATHGEGHIRTAGTLNSLGLVYDYLGEYPKAVEYYTRSLAVKEAAHGEGHTSTADTLNNLGVVYRILGENPKALGYYERSLAIQENTHGEGHISTAETLTNLGIVYRELGEYPQALEYNARSLAVTEATHGEGHISTAGTLNNLSNVYMDLGEYPKALEYYTRSLAIHEATHGEGHISTANTLTNLGIVYRTLGEYPKALEYYTRSLAVTETVYGEGHSSTAVTLNNLSVVYWKLGEYPKALEYCERSLTIDEATFGRGHISTANALNNLGLVYDDLGEYPKALEYYTRSLAVKEATHGGGHISTADTLGNLGIVYSRLGKYPESLEYTARSLAIDEATFGKGHINTAATLNNLSLVWKEQQNPKLAIAYGKRAVNIYQSQRGALKFMEPELQQSYKESIQDDYQNLAKLLFADDQIALGEKILSLLKDTEQSMYRSYSPAAGELLPIDEVEIDAMAEMSDFSRNSYRFNQLVELKNRTAEETVEYKRLRKVVGVEKKVREQKIAQILEPLKGRVMQVGLESTRSTAGQLIALEKEYGHKAAVLYLFPSEETFNHVLITQTGPYVFSTELDPEELNSRIPLLRRALMPDLKSFEKKDVTTQKMDWQENQQELMKHSQWLYDALIRPVEKELNASGVNNLMVYLAGAVRYLPIAALHDGQHYFLENYTLSLLVGSPEKSMGGTRGDAFANLRIAAMGTNTAHTDGDIVLSSLSAIEGELDAVVRERFWDGGSFSGTRFLNKEFTPDAFYEVSEQGEYKLLHLATHFIMQPGFFSSSSLLFGSPELVTINTLGELWSPRKIEVLTLSACSTALSTGGQTYSSDGRGAVEVFAKYASGTEVDSFAAMALQQNIKTVIATLWNIEDKSTALFMTDFYNNLSDTDNFTRSGALRQAQLNLLQNKVDLSQGNKNALVELYGLKDYSHPFFWAPFIMMGQWI